ncbi:hypothetical protein L861_19110 [Litchfieldella anticariensis FP35 = DSM 16096]|uniref:Uncharacterized protein n=1 Tax=Litchfieldella anticariensis (strain DSM 16096 / CECT 5854 / CIP 108499 / LMG 22089 / FP35) TaxID=1121939 RepID=S2LG20_LITA3|nr:hypothetical protein L861_19110 [Halomonas anticariensis FP35 = DSM 16096]
MWHNDLGWGMQCGAINKRPEFEAYWAGLKERPAQRRSEEFIEQMTTQRHRSTGRRSPELHAKNVS